MNEVYRLQPKSIAELGIGFGKYGALCREVLDAMHGRCRPEQWLARIEGIEAHGPYQNPLWGTYNDVWIGDFTQRRTAGYDLVLMIDSLEHLEPEAGRTFLADLVAANKHVIISVPVQYMPQGAAYGNEYETHRTHHAGHEFDQYGPVILNRDMCLTVSIRGRA